MHGSEIERARELIFRHGWNTTCFQLLVPGIELWFATETDAVIGYIRKHHVRVVAGAPVCSEEDLRSTIHEWETAAAAAGDCVCYFGAEDRMRELTAEDAAYSTVVLGSQPVWTPKSLVKRFNADRSLRAQRARAKNKGVVVREWPTQEAHDSPALKQVLHEWLQTRGLPPMHFLVEPETLGMLDGRRIFVATIADKPVAFLVLSPAPARGAWLTEQFVRGRQAPNGTVELMMVEAVSSVEGELVTMGIVPLAQKARDPAIHNPVWLEALSRWARAHGRRFYNFGGLEWFKDKFHPDRWDPIYVISKEPKFSLRTLHAVAAAFTGEPPLKAIARGLLKSIRQELGL
ncbi:MAG: phosphatidylglycerol lysyltransferase domain-containing protein [Fimbriimonas sp.]